MQSRTVVTTDNLQSAAKIRTKAYAKQAGKARLPRNEIAVFAPAKSLPPTAKLEALLLAVSAGVNSRQIRRRHVRHKAGNLVNQAKAMWLDSVMPIKRNRNVP